MVPESTFSLGQRYATPWSCNAWYTATGNIQSVFYRTVSFSCNVCIYVGFNSL